MRYEHKWRYCLFMWIATRINSVVFLWYLAQCDNEFSMKILHNIVYTFNMKIIINNNNNTNEQDICF